MSFEISVHPDSASLPTQFRGLLEEQASPFLDHKWFRIFEAQVAPHIGEPRWMCLRDGPANYALLPMLERQTGNTRLLTSMSNYYSPYFDLLTEAHYKEPYKHFVEAFSEVLKTYDVIELSPLTPKVSNGFRAAFRHLGWHCHRYPLSVNWREKDISNFQKYWANRPGQLRQAVTRKTKKVDKVPHRWVITSDTPTDTQLADYHRVYYHSWKPREPYPCFIDDLVAEFSATSELTLGLLYIDERPVAAQIWMIRGEVAFIYKLAYDPAYQELSPGTLLSARLFEYAISSRGVTTIDYLTGNDGYKKQWTSERRRLFGLQIANPETFRGIRSAVRNRLSELRSCQHQN